jgi:alpha-amylase
MNGTMLQAFSWYLPNDGNHWNWLATEAAGWKKLGFTSLWLPPAKKGFGGSNSVGYDVYDLWDLGRYWAHDTNRTKYGTLDELRNAVAASHAAGLQVYADLVYNHKMGAPGKEWVRVQHVDKDDKNRPLGDWHWRELHTHFHFDDRFGQQGRGGAPTSSNFVWSWDHFDAVELDVDGKRMTFRIKNKQFESSTSDHHGGAPYLMGCDIDTSHPDVYEELCRVGEWMIDALGFDGFRLDAVKHLRTTFFRDFLYRMRHGRGHRNIFAVGEFWSSDAGQLHDYMSRCDNQMSLFDVPLQQRFHDASRAGSHYDMGSLLEGTLMKERPYQAVTFVQNHDTQPLRSLERVVESWFVPLAYAVILLREQGYPCVFHADMYGAHYWDRGRDGSGSHEIWMDNHGWIISKLLEVRRDHAHGAQHDYFDDRHVVGWTRAGAAGSKAIAVIMSNAAGGRKHMYVGKPGATFKDHLGHVMGSITADPWGYADFETLGGKVSVWVEQ